MAFLDYTPDEWFELELEPGLEYRRRFGLEDTWGENEAIYYNVHESMMNDGPNIFLSQGDAMLSTLTVPSARAMISAYKPEDVQKAPLVETMDNQFIDQIKLPNEVDKCALHAYLFGRGFIKFGYDSEWGYDDSLDIGGQLQLGLTLTQLDRTGKRKIEYDGNVQPGMPWGKSVLPHDIIVPWGCYDINDAPWIAHRVVRNIDDLRADPKYSNVRTLQPNTSMRDFVESYRTTQKVKQITRMDTSKNDFVEFFEVQDRRTGKILCICRGWDKFLRKDRNGLQIENRLPFASLSFTPRARSFWTTPDAFYLKFAQAELSDIALQRAKQRRLSVLKFLVEEDAISDEELIKLFSPDAGAAVKIKTGRKFADSVMKLDNQPMNQGWQMEEELIRSNAREQIGFSRNQVGEYSGGRKTASEVNAVERSSQLRMSRRGLAVKGLYEDSLQIINGIAFEHWTLGGYVSVLGPQNAQQFIQINGPQLKGRYGVRIEFVDEQEVQSRKMQALQLYSLLRQDPSVNPQELQSFLTDQVNDPSFGRLFSAPVQPQMSQLPNGSGGASSNNNTRQSTSPVQALQSANAKNGFSNPAGLLAGGRNSP